LNKKAKLENEITAYSFALILSFFSLMEFLLDVFYAFEQPHIKFSVFKKKKWDERFKLIFDLNKEKDIKQIYDEVKEIKREYRNPLTHGLYKEANLLVKFPYIGLIPLSYNYLFDEICYGPGISMNNVCDIINTFESFLNILKNKEPYKFYMLYIDYGFPIPMNEKEMSKIKEKMTSYVEFKEYLEWRRAYEDMIINRDI